MYSIIASSMNRPKTMPTEEQLMPLGDEVEIDEDEKQSALRALREARNNGI